MFLSLKMITPQRNEIITELRLTSDTTEIIESDSLNEEKYAKSPAQMNIEINGMAHLQWNGVDFLRDGYQNTEQMTAIMII